MDEDLELLRGAEATRVALPQIRRTLWGQS